MATYNLKEEYPTSMVSGDVLNIPFTGNCITLTLPRGKFKLEAWGAYGPYSSASPTSSHAYGYGGYASGTLTLTKPLKLYCYVGGMPLATVQNNYYYGGYNGGGSKLYSSNYRDNGPGGGATDFCLVKGKMRLDKHFRYVRDTKSYLSRLLVAGGGGGGRSNNAYSQGGYEPCVTTANGNAYGRMTSPGSVASSTYSVLGGFGYGSTSVHATDDRAAGGGGWYGGGDTGDSYGGGGSSFAWCDTYAGYVPSGYSVGSEYKLTNVSLLLGSGKASPAGTMSDGYARITVIEVESLPGMIYDRTQADADLWLYLSEKLDTGGWASLSSEEQALWLTSLKGAYNDTDLQRVSRAIDYLSERYSVLIPHLVDYRDFYGVASDGLFLVPYEEEDVVVNPKLDWTRTSHVFRALMRQFITDLRTLRRLLSMPPGTPRVPSDMDDLTIGEANNIERLLEIVDSRITTETNDKEKLIRDTATAWCFSGDLLSAEV